MSEGTRIHAYYQSKQGNNYISEYQLYEVFKVDDFEVALEGRADGIIISGAEVTIDEIKSTVAELDSYYEEQKEWHLGQAKCYALMYAHEKNLDHVNIKLTYINQITEERKVKNFCFTVLELEKDIISLIREYLDFYRFIYERTEKRNESAKALEFPYSEFRKGQRKLAKYTYSISTKGGVLFCEAPTGIGKTVSTLFPAVKSFAEGRNEKIFYLTAKNSGKETAYQTVVAMREKGLYASEILLTAKDKICYCPGKACNPDECPYAKGYYTKIKKVLIDALKKNYSFSRETILSIASHNAICPFELSLDLSLYVDIIICDYNYFFDPIVYLKRYFDEDALNNVVLVDEAHNLVERGRSMYSASISESSFKRAKKAMRHLEHKKLKNATKRITKLFSSFESVENGDTEIPFLMSTELNAIDAYLLAASDVNKHHHEFVTDEFTDFFFELNKFRKLIDYYDERFCLYIAKSDNDLSINLFCMDPSDLLRRTLQKVKSKVIFSATLTPLDYYLGMIGGSEDDPLIMLPSPFDKKNLGIMVAPNISVKYKNRDATLKHVASYLKAFISGKVGNYFIYVPSYEYLTKLVPYLDFGDANLIIQEKDMDDRTRQDFLSCFVDKPTKTTVGIAIVGGAFGEGVDLTSDRLIGVAVIGVGIPQICFERDKIREYFNKIEKDGYLYSYVNPGINKVMQAVGRVIRSETDRGMALLIDDRYLTKTYSDLFENKWSNYEVVTSEADIKQLVDDFWKD
jgi:Rad3-related DNA helicase